MVSTSFFICFTAYWLSDRPSSNNELVKGNSDLKLAMGIRSLNSPQEQQKVEREQAANDEKN